MLPFAMATEKTTTIAVRVPVEVAERLKADADDFNRTPGQHLRSLLEGRYATPLSVRQSNGIGRKTNFEEGLQDADDDDD